MPPKVGKSKSENVNKREKSPEKDTYVPPFKRSRLMSKIYQGANGFFINFVDVPSILSIMLIFVHFKIYQRDFHPFFINFAELCQFY